MDGIVSTTLEAAVGDDEDVDGRRAVTVAVRGLSVSRAISPNQSPEPRSATSYPSSTLARRLR